MNLAEEFYRRGVDLSKLPTDCSAVASQRLIRFWNEARGKFSESYTQIDYSVDLRIVFGDPMKRVSRDSSFLEKSVA